METSEQIDKIIPAFLKFQQEAENPKRDTKAYNYKYATLDSILDIVKPILNKHGLCVNQSVGHEDKKVTVQTVIWHESGQYIKFDELGLGLDSTQNKSKVQGAGSSITYARRYSLSAALGIASEDDTDATPNKRKTKKKQKSKPKKKTPGKKKKTGREKEVEKLVNGKDDRREEVINALKYERENVNGEVRSVNDLSNKSYKQLIDTLQEDMDAANQQDEPTTPPEDEMDENVPEEDKNTDVPF